MKYFIARLRIAESSGDLLFSLLKEGKREGIELLDLLQEDPKKTNGSRPKAIDNWTSASEYYGDVIKFMTPGKVYDIKVLAKSLQIKNLYKHKGNFMVDSTKITLLNRMIKEGKLVADGKNMVMRP